MRPITFIFFLLFFKQLFGQQTKQISKIYAIEVQPKTTKLLLDNDSNNEASTKIGATVSGLVFIDLHSQFKF